jgi:hypothetical protein
MRQYHAARPFLILFRNIVWADNRKAQRKTIQLLFDGHVSLAQRQTVASFSAPRVTK